LTCKQYVKQNL